MDKPKKTHEEYMAIAKVLGRHLSIELNSSDPITQDANLAIHFLSDVPRCPLCLDRVVKAAATGTLGK